LSDLRCGVCRAHRGVALKLADDYRTIIVESECVAHCEGQDEDDCAGGFKVYGIVRVLLLAGFAMCRVVGFEEHVRLWIRFDVFKRIELFVREVCDTSSRSISLYLGDSFVCLSLGLSCRVFVLVLFSVFVVFDILKAFGVV